MMNLYSGTTCPFSQRCRIVLYEKGMDFQIIDVDMYNKPEDIAVMNPYNRLPVLVERDLILYEANIINEYIDERFPHPQLMPADPVMRARARLFLFQFEVELFAHIEALENGNQKQQDRARQHVADQLTQMAPVFTKQKYMLGDEFSMLDVAISPLLWRLDYYGVSLPKPAAPLMKYAERLFSRPAFIEALTPSGKVMRKCVRNGEIVLNIGPHAASCLQMGNEVIECTARFSGVARELVIPVTRVAAIYARENGHGMSFEVEKKATALERSGEEAATQPDPKDPLKSGGKPTL